MNIDDILNAISDPKAKRDAKEFYDLFMKSSRSADEIRKALQTIQSIYGNLGPSANNFSGNLRDQFDLLKQINSSLQSQASNIGKASRAFDGLVNIGQELASEMQGADRLDKKRLDRLVKEAKQRIKIFKREAEQIKDRRRNEGLATDAESIRRQALAETNRVRQKTLEKEAEIVAAYDNELDALNRIANAAERRQQREINMQKSLGLTNALLKATEKLLNNVGLGAFSEEITAALEDIQDQATQDLEKKIDLEIENSDLIKEAGKNIADAEFKKNNLLQAQTNMRKALLEQGVDQEEIEKRVNKLFKQRLELQDSVIDSQQKAIDAEEDRIERSTKLSGQAISTLGALGGAAGKVIGEAFRQPIVLLGLLFANYSKLDEANVNFQRLTGQNAKALSGMNAAMVPNVETLELMVNASEKLGRNFANLVPTSELGNIAEAAGMLGIQGEASGQLAANMALAGMSSSTFLDAVDAGSDAVNLANKSAVPLGMVMQDVANASFGLSLSLGSNPKAIAAAATEARRLGLTLAQMEGIADSMLDFESSIQKELEAQLLTGRQINLGRAREAAMMNDMKTLGEEIGKAGGIADEFSKSNRITQKALAESLGMSREDLAKMVALRQMDEGLTAEQVANNVKMSKEQVMQFTLQQKISKLTAKLGQSLAPLIDMLIPLVDIISVPLRLTANFLSMISSVGPAIKDFYDDNFKEPIERATKGISGMFDGLLGGISDNPVVQFLMKLTTGLAGGAVTIGVSAAIAKFFLRGMTPATASYVKLAPGGLTGFSRLMGKGNLSMGRTLNRTLIRVFGRRGGAIFQTLSKPVNYLSGRFTALGRYIKTGTTTIGKFTKGLNIAMKPLGVVGKLVGPMLRFAGVIGIIASIGQILYEGYNNIKELGTLKGLGKTLEDNLFTIALGAVGAIFGPLGIAIGSGIGALLDSFDLAKKIREWWNSLSLELQLGIGALFGPFYTLANVFSQMSETLSNLDFSFGFGGETENEVQTNTPKTIGGETEYAIQNTTPVAQDFISRPGMDPLRFDRGDIVMGLRPEALSTDEGNSNTVIAKLDEMITRIEQIKGNVFIDGNKAGNAIFATATNLS